MIVISCVGHTICCVGLTKLFIYSILYHWYKFLAPCHRHQYHQLTTAGRCCYGRRHNHYDYLPWWVSWYYNDHYHHLPIIFIPFTINHHTYFIASSWRIVMTAIMVVLCWPMIMSYDINLHMVWPFYHYHNTIIIIIIIIWFSYHRPHLALRYHQSWSMANDRTMDPYRSITINPSMIDTSIRWMSNRLMTI